VTPQDRADPCHEPGVCCPACKDEYSVDDRTRFRERQRQIELAEARGEQHPGAGPWCHPAS
jgi:UPF0176 protein